MDPSTNEAPPSGPAPQPDVPPTPPTPVPAPEIPPSSPPVGPAAPGANVVTANIEPAAPTAPSGQATQAVPEPPQASALAPTMSANSTPPKMRVPMWLLATILAIVILAAVVAAFFMFGKKDTNSASNNAAATSMNAAKNATSMASLSGVILNAPTPMPAGFTLHDVGVATVKDYTYANGTCDLQFGTLTSAQLPGNDVGDILAPQIKTFRDAGATVDGPHTGTALLVSGTAAATNYSMPTLMLTFQKDAKRAISHYSAVILKDGNRAFVSRSCVNATGAVNPATFNAVEAAAEKLTLTKQ